MLTIVRQDCPGVVMEVPDPAAAACCLHDGLFHVRPPAPGRPGCSCGKEH